MSTTAHKESKNSLPTQLSDNSHDLRVRDMLISLVGLTVIGLVLTLNG